MEHGILVKGEWEIFNLNLTKLRNVHCTLFQSDESIQLSVGSKLQYHTQVKAFDWVEITLEKLRTGYKSFSPLPLPFSNSW